MTAHFPKKRIVIILFYKNRLLRMAANNTKADKPSKDVSHIFFYCKNTGIRIFKNFFIIFQPKTLTAMRKLITAAVLLIISHVTFAQKGLPEFGKIDKEDLQMKECDIDKDAVAYKLIDYGDVSYQTGRDVFKIVTERRIRIKILKDKGLDYANIKIQFYSKNNVEDISNIAGYTYNLDDAGNIITTKLDKASIFKKPLDNQFSEVVFTMPGVKAGSVIEYKFKDAEETFSHLDDWYFQDEIPTRISIYKISIPEMFRFVTQVLTY